MKLSLRQKEWLVLLPMLAAVNLTLLWGRPDTNLIYLSDNACAGQFYRFLTAPFVHVSLYHLFVDGIAFVMLYASLPYAAAGKRLLCLAGIHTAVMTAVTVFPGSAGLGYCGLSGIDHGLMALWCLEMMRNPQKQIKHTGGFGLAIVTTKCVFEAIRGQVVFASLHLGDVGIPVVSSHWGGLLGGITVYFAMRLWETCDFRRVAVGVAAN
jgi:rhomboid family GlyGly-CTERM serine protease